MALNQGGLDTRYNPSGIDPTNIFMGAADRTANMNKGLDPSGRGAEERAYMYDMLKMYYQNNWTEYMWNQENQYNSTPEQLKRWIEAGGNPNAFFGGGTNTGNASSVTSASPGSGNPAYGMGMEALQGASQLTKDFWEQRKTKAEAEQKEIENGTLHEINEATLEQIRKNAKKIESETHKTNADTKQVLEMLPYLKGKTSAEIEVLDQEKNKLQQEGENLKQMHKKLKAETWEAVCKAYIKNWEAWYRRAYGVNPESGWVNMILQYLTGATDILKPGQTWDNMKLYLKSGWDNTKEFWDMMKEYGLEDFEGDGK